MNSSLPWEGVVGLYKGLVRVRINTDCSVRPEQDTLEDLARRIEATILKSSRTIAHCVCFSMLVAKSIL